MKRRRLWCYHCQRRALFPTLHFVIHTLDGLKAATRKGREMSCRWGRLPDGSACDEPSHDHSDWAEAEHDKWLREVQMGAHSKPGPADSKPSQGGGAHEKPRPGK